jgi:hypothetical protein
MGRTWRALPKNGGRYDETSSNREKAEKAFRDWHDGTGSITSITDLLADNLRWTIVGRSQAAKTYDSKEQFIGEVLQPFGARFRGRYGRWPCAGSMMTATPWSWCGTGKA